MKVYAYCSYRNSRYGFQYCEINLHEKVCFSMLAKETAGQIPKEFVQWCEQDSNWHLVLKKDQNQPDYYWLMVGRLEHSRRIEKKQDSDFYMTLGFYGKAGEIKYSAIGFALAYQDGFQEIFNQLETTISKTEDSSNYQFNVSKFKKVMRELCEGAEEKASQIPQPFNSTQRQKGKPYPDSYFSIENPLQTQKQKKFSIQNDIAKLLRMEQFSEPFLFLIAYHHFDLREKVNIRIDYEYLWRSV